MYVGVHCSDMPTSQLSQNTLQEPIYIDLSAILKTWDREAKIDFSPNSFVMSTFESPCCGGEGSLVL